MRRRELKSAITGQHEKRRFQSARARPVWWRGNRSRKCANKSPPLPPFMAPKLNRTLASIIIAHKFARSPSNFMLHIDINISQARQSNRARTLSGRADQQKATSSSSSSVHGSKVESAHLESKSATETSRMWRGRANWILGCQRAGKNFVGCVAQQVARAPLGQTGRRRKSLQRIRVCAISSAR